jgi:hypothetical protein
VRSRVSREYAHEDVGWFRCLQEALLYYVLLYSKRKLLFTVYYYDSTKLYCSTRYGFRHGRYLMSYNLYITPLQGE